MNVPGGGRVEREVVGPLALDHLRAGDPSDVAMELVGRLERHGRALRPAVGEQEGLQHLVRPVGGEDLVGTDAVPLGDRRPQLERGPVRVAVPLDGGERGRQLLAPALGRRVRRLVDVEPHGDVDAGRVVPRERPHVVARGDRVSSTGASTTGDVTGAARTWAHELARPPPPPPSSSAAAEAIGGYAGDGG